MSQKEYDKLLGRDDTEKVLVDVANYFVSLKPIRTLQTIKVKERVASKNVWFSSQNLRKIPFHYIKSCDYVINKISS